MTNQGASTYHIVSHSPAIVWAFPVQIDSRLDAQPFQPELLIVEQLLTERPDCVRLGAKLQRQRGLTGGATPLGANYPREGIHFIRTENVTPNWIDLADVVFISPEDHVTLKRSALEADDVLLTITGALFGQSATVYPECLPANISQHSVRMMFIGSVNPRYVATYLNSKYGQAQIQKHKVGATRSAIDYEGVRALRLPLPSNAVQDYIGAKVRLAERCRLRAKAALGEAKKRLTDLLDLNAFSPSTERHSLIEPAQMSERLAAEFYLPVYLDLDRHLSLLPLQVVHLSALGCSVLRTITPDRTEGGAIPCILTSDIEPQEIRVQQPSLRIDRPTYDQHPGKLRASDVVYTSVGPPVGEAALVLPEYLPMVIGGDVSVLRVDGVLNPGYLCLYMNSVFGQMQNERYARGIRQRRVYPEDISDFRIPVPDRGDQDFIGERVILFQRLNSRAANLVHYAQSDVEALIEGWLDVDGIIAGRIKPPTWDEIGG